MAKTKVSNEMATAAMIHAMLTGESIESAADSVDFDFDEDEVELDTSEDGNEVINGIEIDIDENGKSKSKKTKKAKKESKPKKVKKTEEELKAEREAADIIPVCEWAELAKSQRLIVTFNQHIIPYKEQEWNIDQRQVAYEIVRADSKRTAGRIIRQMFKEPTQEQYDAANNGEVRYYELRVMNDIVPSRAVTLGFIEVRPDKKNRIKVDKENIKNNNIDYDVLIGDIRKAVKAAVKYS